MQKIERNNKKIPSYILAWFFLDAFLALTPPLYWMVNDYRMILIFGIPASLAYFIFISVFIALSLVVAYIVEERNGAFE